MNEENRNAHTQMKIKINTVTESCLQIGSESMLFSVSVFDFIPLGQ